MVTTNIQSFSGDVEVASDLTVTSNLTVDTNTLHVDSVAGRVGIGKTNPAYAIDVNGTLNATSLYLGGTQLEASPWTQDNSNIYYTSNVGIGTNAPGKTLDVNGTLRVSDPTTSTSSDISIGYNSDLNLNTPFPLTASDAQGYDYFGYHCSISNDGSYAIAGARNEGGSNRGAAYIYEKSGTTWDSGTKLVSSDLANNDSFGSCVRISDDGSWAMVASAGGKGNCYVFKKSGSTWDSGIKLTNPNIGPAWAGGTKGASDMSSDGSWVVLSAYFAEKAVVFKRTSATNNTWDSGVLLQAPAPGKRFGPDCAISGDGSFLAVGAMFGHPGDGTKGAAYVFKRSTSGNTWGSPVEILASDGAGQDRFGTAIDISDDGSWLIVGSPNAAGTSYRSGKIYVYNRTHPTNNAWGNEHKILGGRTDYLQLSQKYGVTKSISISKYGDTIAAKGTGEEAALIYKRTHPTNNTWGASTPVLKGQGIYSSSVSLGENDLIVGSSDLTTRSDTFFTGGAYVFAAAGNVLSVSTPIESAGTTLSFTGQHICFPEGSMSQGLVVSANKNKYVTLNGPLTTGAKAIKSSESLPVVSLSNVVNDRSAFGVVDHIENSTTTRRQTSGVTIIKSDKELGDNRVIVNSLGEGAMWVANTNGPLESGDYITTSNIAGYGQRQYDDILHSYTVAKITMDCDFEPKEIPVQVILKDDDGNNVLDSYGRLQWMVTDRTEPEYQIRYLDVSGTPTDQANAVWKAAYVGCTYHCG